MIGRKKQYAFHLLTQGTDLIRYMEAFRNLKPLVNVMSGAQDLDVVLDGVSEEEMTGLAAEVAFLLQPFSQWIDMLAENVSVSGQDDAVGQPASEG